MYKQLTMSRQVFLKFTNVKGFLGVKNTVIIPLSTIKKISIYKHSACFETDSFIDSGIKCNFIEGTTEEDAVRHITNKINSGKTIINF